MLRNPNAVDRVDSIALARDLEYVETEVYKARYPALKARFFVPILGNVPEWAQVYTWREEDVTGDADFITGNGKDAPRVEVNRNENHRSIYKLGASYAYTEDEIIAAQKMGVQLDTDRATGARFMVERKIDKLLAFGATSRGLKGLLTLDGTTGLGAYTASNKAAGSGGNLKLWGTLTAPIATADEVANDLIGFATFMYTRSDEIWDRFAIGLSPERYAYAAGKRLGDNTTTALAYVRATCPFITEITPWNRCRASAGHGAGANERAVAYAKDPSLIAGIVSREPTPRPAERNGEEWSTLITAKTGGVVVKNSVVIGYMDSF